MSKGWRIIAGAFLSLGWMGRPSAAGAGVEIVRYREFPEERPVSYEGRTVIVCPPCRAPSIDGKLDETAWIEATEVSTDKSFSLKLAADAEFLYVGATLRGQGEVPRLTLSLDGQMTFRTEHVFSIDPK